MAAGGGWTLPEAIVLNGRNVCKAHHLVTCHKCCMDFTWEDELEDSEDESKPYYLDVLGYRYCKEHDEEVCKACGVNEKKWNAKKEKADGLGKKGKKEKAKREEATKQKVAKQEQWRSPSSLLLHRKLSSLETKELEKELNELMEKGWMERSG